MSEALVNLRSDKLTLWYEDTQTLWYTFALVYCCSGMLVLWYAGALVYWCSGILALWCVDTSQGSKIATVYRKT